MPLRIASRLPRYGLCAAGCGAGGGVCARANAAAATTSTGSQRIDFMRGILVRQEVAQPTFQRGAEFRVGERKGDERLEIGFEVADVVAVLAGPQADAVGAAAAADHRADRIGQLN